MAKKTKEQIAGTHFGQPGPLAIARNQAGGDWAAGMLWYRICWRWRMKKKIHRLGLDWVAMSRADWAREAGLSIAEMKNRALPNLRKQQFIKIRQMMLKDKKLLFVSVDLGLVHEAGIDLETFDELINGMKYPGYEKASNSYPYKSQE